MDVLVHVRVFFRLDRESLACTRSSIEVAAVTKPGLFAPRTTFRCVLCAMCFEGFPLCVCVCL